MPPPRSKSPIKTFLKSPARRHPSLGPVSSPTRGSIISPPRVNPPPSVIRKLDFSADDLGNKAVQVVRSSPQKKNKVNVAAPVAPTVNGSGSVVKQLKPAFQENMSPSSARRSFNLASPDDGEEEEYYQPINYDDQDLDDSQEAPAEPEPEPTPPKPTKKRVRSPVTTARGLKTRPRRVSPELDVQETESVAQEQSEASEQEEEPVEEKLPPPKKQKKNIPTTKTQPIKKPPPISKPKPTKRRQLSPTMESSPPPIQHGPPRPRQNGLFILRRETPGLGNFAQTRSGRVSVKPVAYWKNEAVVYGEDEAADGDESFIMPTIKEVIRREEAVSESPRKGKRRGPKPAKQKKREELESDSEDDADLAEPWESEPGRIYGEIRDWNPEDQVGVESAEREEEIAFSNAAIITREIPGSNVKFAKTLTLPFFGSGMVDLPPGAIKKPKNSRKMQMVFFVHYGRVNVTVNNNAFRIGKGGMWQVPRGKDDFPRCR
jgi:centromere protein C